MSKNNITNRTELLFLYEIENANPNGDPLNENRPRFDTEESKALVSDVRLKRTIRDYWFAYKGHDGTNGKDIFVRETKYAEKGKNYVKSGKKRAEDFRKSKDVAKDIFVNNILDQCIDIRVFGGVIPLDNDSITFTGPTQFQMGKSLNKTNVVTEQGTGAFASGDRKAQSTFRMEYKLPYALIGFNGIINEKAAEYSNMSEEDKKLLLEGIWEGTKNLISRSKFGQNPIFLLAVNYTKPYHIGNLRQRLKMNSEIEELKIRSTEDFKLDITKLLTALKSVSENISSISIRTDDRLQMIKDGEAVTFSNGEINLNEL